MLKAALADKAQQLLQVRDLDYACAAERVQRVVGEASFAYVAAHLAGSIVSGEAGETHLLGFDQAHTGSEGIFLAHGAGNDLLKIHFHRAEKMFREVRAV